MRFLTWGKVLSSAVFKNWWSKFKDSVKAAALMMVKDNVYWTKSSHLSLWQTVNLLILSLWILLKASEYLNLKQNLCNSDLLPKWKSNVIRMRLECLLTKYVTLRRVLRMVREVLLSSRIKYKFFARKWVKKTVKLVT